MPRSKSSTASSPTVAPSTSKQQKPSSSSGAPPTTAASPPDIPSVPETPTVQTGLGASAGPVPSTGLGSVVLSSPAVVSPVTAPTTTPAAVVPPGVGMPPAMTFPPLPVGYVEPNMRAYLGCHPTKTQLAAVLAAITDLGNFVDYTTVLGASAPEAPAVAGLLTVGISWRALRNESQAWTAFVNAQDAMAWKPALASLEELKPLFLIAVAKNPALAGMYPGLTQLFDAGKVTARLAAATKKKAAQAQATAAKKAAADEAAADKAAAKAASASAAATTAPKTVTVSA